MFSHISSKLVSQITSMLVFVPFSDGWEAGALHEFYKIKLPFIKQREIREKVEKVKEMAMKQVETKSGDNERR